MKTQTRPLALATALLSIGFAMGGRAEGGIALQTPAELTAGEQFRFVFVTDGTTTATSMNITDYNNFVTAQAGGATYNGSAVTWSAIASTTTESAIDNIGQAPITGVYLANGTLITTSTTTSGLWSGSIINPIDLDLSSTNPGGDSITWNGTNVDGTTQGAFALGGSSGIAGFGFDNTATSGWVFNDFFGTGDSFRMYGISQVLTVTSVPEPSTLLMAVTAISVGLAIGWSPRRRDRLRQRPTGKSDATE
jgi:hypothetical protein